MQGRRYEKNLRPSKTVPSHLNLKTEKRLLVNNLEGAKAPSPKPHSACYEITRVLIGSTAVFIYVLHSSFCIRAGQKHLGFCVSVQQLAWQQHRGFLKRWLSFIHLLHSLCWEEYQSSHPYWRWQSRKLKEWSCMTSLKMRTRTLRNLNADFHSSIPLARSIKNCAMTYIAWAINKNQIPSFWFRFFEKRQLLYLVPLNSLIKVGLPEA